MNHRALRLTTAVAVLLVATIAIWPHRAKAVTTWQVIASGLDNPRGLAFSADGALYVAEAGEGGPGPCYLSSDDSTNCIGESGAVSRIKNGVVDRIVDNLPSAADGIDFAAGPHDVSLQGNGNLLVTIGLGAPPAVRQSLGTLGAKLASLVRVTPNGAWQVVADLGAYEGAEDPNDDGPDSNPYGLLAEAGRTLALDAGGNSLIAIGANKKISTLAVFPNRDVPAPPFLPFPTVSMDAVPTAITKGSDGWYYISQLTGFPFPVGDSRIFRWRAGSAPEVYCAGQTSLTNVVDIAAAADGSLYLAEISTNGLLSEDLAGRIVRVWPNCAQTEVASEGLVAPTSVAIGPDGALYVSNFGVFANGGEVLRIEP